MNEKLTVIAISGLIGMKTAMVTSMIRKMSIPKGSSGPVARNLEMKQGAKLESITPRRWPSTEFSSRKMLIILCSKSSVRLMLTQASGCNTMEMAIEGLKLIPQYYISGRLVASKMYPDSWLSLRQELVHALTL